MIVYAIAVLGLILLTGFNGQISLGHGAFFAVGAYTAAILIDQADWPYWATLPVAALMCFVVGYLFGLPALRLEGHYLALATFALAVAVPQILKYRHFEPFTHGVQGINIFKPDPPFGLPLSTDQWMYLVVLALAVADVLDRAQSARQPHRPRPDRHPRSADGRRAPWASTSRTTRP